MVMIHGEWRYLSMFEYVKVIMLDILPYIVYIWDEAALHFLINADSDVSKISADTWWIIFLWCNVLQRFASWRGWPQSVGYLSIFVAQMLVIQSLTKRVPVRGTITGGGGNPWDEDVQIHWNMTQKTYIRKHWGQAYCKYKRQHSQWRRQINDYEEGCGFCSKKDLWSTIVALLNGPSICSPVELSVHTIYTESSSNILMPNCYSPREFCQHSLQTLLRTQMLHVQIPISLPMYANKKSLQFLQMGLHFETRSHSIKVGDIFASECLRMLPICQNEFKEICHCLVKRSILALKN